MITWPLFGGHNLTGVLFSGNLPSMTIASIPNLLSLTRIFLTPVFVVLFWQPDAWLQLLAYILFTVAALTDALDGHLARAYNVTSTWGSFLDPLADKILVTSGLVCLALKQLVPWYLIIIIVLRDGLVTWLKVRAQRRGLKLATTWLAKTKTVAQFIALYLGFAACFLQLHDHGWLDLFMLGVGIFTVYTGWDYACIYYKTVGNKRR